MAEPTQITITGAPEGYNCRLSVSGYGVLAVRVNRIAYETQFVSEEAESAQTKSFYPQTVLDPAFTLEFAHANWAERETFNGWMSTYMRRVSTGARVSGYMLVQIPARRFTRKAVPVGPLTFGDTKDQWGRVYVSQIQFSGASDPMAAAKASQFHSAQHDSGTSAAFFPAGAQRSGAESLAGTIFDDGSVFTPAASQSRLNRIERMLGPGAIQ